jgi:putative oxidoreductase
VAITLVNIRDVHALDDFVELNEVLYVMVLLWLMVAGPGRVSVDHWLARKLSLRPA